MQNIPKMKVGIVAVSRDCFPESLSVNRKPFREPPQGARFGVRN